MYIKLSPEALKDNKVAATSYREQLPIYFTWVAMSRGWMVRRVVQAMIGKKGRAFDSWWSFYVSALRNSINLLLRYRSLEA